MPILSTPSSLTRYELRDASIRLHDAEDLPAVLGVRWLGSGADELQEELTRDRFAIVHGTLPALINNTFLTTAKDQCFQTGGCGGCPCANNLKGWCEISSGEGPDSWFARWGQCVLGACSDDGDITSESLKL